jgi:N-methylhydantoinase B
MSDSDSSEQRVRPASAVELEVFKHLLASVAEEMGERLMRSAYSPNIKERRDFSCALCSAEGELIAQAAHIPVHLGALPLSVQALLAAFPRASMLSGERYILNDPFAGGTHLPDITVITPVIPPGEDQPLFFAVTRAHHSDVGGLSAGSMSLARHIDEEGLRLPPARLSAALLDQVCAASRTPQERRGDLQAQLAAVEAGSVSLSQLCARYGARRVALRAAELLAYTERMLRQAIRALPDGEYRFTDFLDGDGVAVRDILLHCVLRITGDSAEVDLTASGDQVPGPLNAVRAVTLSAVSYCFRCLLPEDVPSNSGVMRPITLRTTPGSVVDALYPAAVAAGNVETSQRIVDVVLGALAMAAPQLIPAASQGTMNNLTIGGTDPRSGQPFTYYETIAGGAGAGPSGSGACGIHTHMTNTLNTPVEAMEHAYPLRIEHYRLRPRSGGAGRHRGGDGLLRRITVLGEAEVTLLAERRRHMPYGLQGGDPGECGQDTLYRGDGAEEELSGKFHVRLSPDDSIQIATPGGGGWGGADDSVPPS